MTKPTAKEIKAMTEITGVPVDAEVAGAHRPFRSARPSKALRRSRGTLPFDLEPATFRLVQAAKGSK